MRIKQKVYLVEVRDPDSSTGWRVVDRYNLTWEEALAGTPNDEMRVVVLEVVEVGRTIKMR